MDNYKKEILSPTLKIVKLMIEYPAIYKSINISSLQEFQPYQNGEYTEGNNVNIYNSSKFSNFNSNYISKEKYKNINNNQMSKSGEIFQTLSCDSQDNNALINTNLDNNTNKIKNKTYTPLRNNRNKFNYNEKKKKMQILILEYIIKILII